MSAAPAIRLEDVTLSLDGRTVLDRLCLEVVSGSVTAVIGPNGAGKSVTLRVIDGLLRADLVIVDELGFAPLDPTGTQLLFRFVAAASEHRSLGIASHWPFEQWGRFMADSGGRRNTQVLWA